jgi:AraC-like DNA-binding protein
MLVTVVLYSLFSIAWGSDILAVVSNERMFVELSIFILAFAIIFLFLLNFRYPHFYQSLHIITEKYKRSYLDDLDLSNIQSKLHFLMEEEELFTDEDLSLPQLAKVLDITTHQLSQLLNDRLGQNFASFVNHYRIEKAKTLLLDKRQNTILSIAFGVGFKSKSTFNAAFLKHTGTSPSQFRKHSLSKLS